MRLTEEAAKRALQDLLRDYDQLQPEDRRQMSEASVVRQFIDRLLRDVLGWPIEDPARYKYELVTQVGRPDITLIPEAGGMIFIEAKRFGALKELVEARRTVRGVITPGQLSLPGMAVDRTPEEQQAINYAFANGGEWAILTNFEKLRLFNARRDWLVLSFERPAAYLDEFDLLWELAYPNIASGRLSVLSNQRVTAEVDTDYLKFINEWRERLAQDLVTHRAQNPWAFHANGGINLPELRAVVQRIIDRLVIIRFAEDHLVVPPGTLRGLYELRQQNQYSDLDQMLDTLFRRFDQAHNSALFAYGLADDAVFSDDILIALLRRLYEARYRSMSPDIMGNTYEQYLGKALALTDGGVTTRDNLETRKKQGSYYTPQVIVRHLVDTTLGRVLYGTVNGKPDGEPVPGEARKTSRDIRDLRVLDSACGSGSFLIYAYEVLADFYQSEIARLQADMLRRADALAAAGVSPFDRELALADERVELERIRDYPRLILETHLYGVDLDPQAAEIAVVNLMMRGMERRQQEKRLPLLLNQNIKVGNGLVGLRPDDPRLAEHAAGIAAVRRLRERLVQTPNGPEHDAIIADLEAAGAALRGALDAHTAPHFTDLEHISPFHWGIEFPEVFFDADGAPLDNPGFTIIIGNPPWEILKPDLREFYAQFDPDIESKLNRAQVERRIAQLQLEDPRRVELWETQKRTIEETAAYIRRSPDYTRQGKGDTATHKLFLERMYGLLADRGRLGYVVPSGIYTDLGTKGLREMLLNEGNIQYIYSFSNERFFFPGVHHSFKFVLLGAQKGPQTDGFWCAFRFNPRVAVAPDDLPAFLADPANLIYMRRDSLERFSPDSLSMMEFQTRRDYEVAEKVYDGWPLLGPQPHPKSLSVDGEGLEDASPMSVDGEGLTARGEGLQGATPLSVNGEGPGVRFPTERVIGSEVGERWLATPAMWDLLKPLARQMRAAPTLAERLLWEHLRDRQVGGLKFRRQHGIERFIVDFYCAEMRLVIEVDGPIHEYTQEEDAVRQQFLESQGLRVLRFTNDEVLNDLPSVLARIEPHPKSLSVDGEGLEGASPMSVDGEDLTVRGQDSPSPSTERGQGVRFPGVPLPWSIRLNREFDMANDRALLNTAGQGVPLCEGKMIHQYDAFFELPQYWIAPDRLANLSETVRKEISTYRVVHRRIARSTDERTLIAAIVPINTACDTNATMVLIEGSANESVKFYVCALFNTFMLDYVIRYKVSTTLNMFYLYQLPLPRLTAGNPYFDALVPRAARLTCTRPEFADLWQEVMGAPWDESCGATDPAERGRLRDEIDALVAHLYGLSRADFNHILGTFPLVFPETDAGRAKRESLLAEYDRMATVTATWPRR